MYIKLKDGQPENYTIGQLRKDNPRTSFPRQVPKETLLAYGVYEVTDEPRPDVDPMTHRVERAPISGGGVDWKRGWNIVELSASEKSEKALEKRKEYEQAVQRLLDKTAQDKGYNSIISMCSYGSSTKPQWKAEAVAANKWRDDCWNEALVQLGNYIASGTIPDLDTFIASMPKPNWPNN